MSGELITNNSRKLIDEMKDVLSSSESLYFLVGYFYFSGFKELYQELENKEIKILVGMDIDPSLSTKIKEYSIVVGDETEVPDIEVRNTYYTKFVDLFNDTDFFDNKGQIESFKLFVKKIKDGTLQLRKTRKPNHSKMYLFEKAAEFSENGRYPGLLITGSSNFSYSGLSGRNEINVVFRDKTFLEGKQLFDDIWNNDSIDLISTLNKDDFFNEVVQKIWVDKIPDPYLLFVRVLYEYFMVDTVTNVKLPYEITKHRFYDFKYQIDAIKSAITIINKHNGVIIADVVGLGKSIIASTVAHNLGLKAIVIAPPHLMRQWEEYRQQFSFIAEIVSSGAIEKAFDKLLDEKMLIIVDEAARFRNETTKDYALLHQLCQGNKVMLLTATPFNNKPEDIFSLIKLFQIPTRSTIKTVNDLLGTMKRLISEYKKINKEYRKGTLKEDELKNRVGAISLMIRDIIFPLIIRRTRIDLGIITEYRTDLEKQGVEFPQVADPESVTYDLGTLTPLYEKTLDDIYSSKNDNRGFIGARYKPVSYLKKGALSDLKKTLSREEYKKIEYLMIAQKNIAGFMRRLLVRRFESSIKAFKVSVDSMLKSCLIIKKWYDKGRIPMRKKGNIPDVDTLFAATGDEQIENLNEWESKLDELKDESGYYFFNSDDLELQFLQDLNKDIKLLQYVKKQWEEVSEDPKLLSFAKIIKDQLRKEPNRKIIVFSEFADTVHYLVDKLTYGLNVMSYSGQNANKTSRDLIKKNFDAGLTEKEQLNDYDVLIATDAISEGFNLHRAGIVFNYDIPYNPTRVIQRIGRINRINKKVFDTLYIYNFFPSMTGEKEVATKTISTFKMAIIHALIGEDIKVLTSDEEINHYFAEKLKKEKESEEDESWDAQYRNEFYLLKSQYPQVLEAALALPKRSRVKRSVKKDLSGVLLFGKKGGECAFKFCSSDGTTQEIVVEKALFLLEANKLEKGKVVSEMFEPLYTSLKSSLFSRETDPNLADRTSNTIDILKSWKPKLLNESEYLRDLLFVVQKLHALPELYMKMIRNIDEESLIEDFNLFKQEVPHKYLLRIIKQGKNSQNEAETIILAEELI